MTGTTNRKADRIRKALAAMANGQDLHLQFRAGTPIWTLTDGRVVPAEVDEILTHHELVVPVGDALFDGLSQTWRFDFARWEGLR